MRKLLYSIVYFVNDRILENLRNGEINNAFTEILSFSIIILTLLNNFKEILKRGLEVLQGFPKNIKQDVF